MSFITTVSGKRFYLDNPDVSEIDPEDIAYALSNLCRYTGHTKRFYSVAEHCVLVSHHVPQEGDGHAGYAMAGLLHDAAEAFTGDINHPLKQMLDGTFSGIESSIERAIARRFGVTWPWGGPVKKADEAAYWTEIRDIAPRRPEDSYGHDGQRTGTPWDEKVEGWIPEQARHTWLLRFYELGGK